MCRVGVCVGVVPQGNLIWTSEVKHLGYYIGVWEGAGLCMRLVQAGDTSKEIRF